MNSLQPVLLPSITASNYYTDWDLCPYLSARVECVKQWDTSCYLYFFCLPSWFKRQAADPPRIWQWALLTNFMMKKPVLPKVLSLAFTLTVTVIWLRWRIKPQQVNNDVWRSVHLPELWDIRQTLQESPHFTLFIWTVPQLHRFLLWLEFQHFQEDGGLSLWEVYDPDWRSWL